MGIDKLLIVLFAFEGCLEFFLERVEVLGRNSKVVNNMFSIPFLRPAFLLLFICNCFIKSFFKLVFLSKIFQSHCNWIFNILKDRIFDFFILLKKLDETIDKFSGPFWFLRFEGNRVNKSWIDEIFENLFSCFEANRVLFWTKSIKFDNLRNRVANIELKFKVLMIAHAIESFLIEFHQFRRQ